MKKNKKLIALVGIILFGSITTAFAAPKSQKEITYYLMSFTEQADSKPFGCGEFLIPVKKKIKKPDLKKVLSEFTKAHTAAMGPQTQGKPFGFAFFLVDKIQEPKKPSTANPIKVYLKQNPKIPGSTMCDDPRATEPIKETISEYAGSRPVKIFFNGSEKEWRCFGDMSGLCQ